MMDNASLYRARTLLVCLLVSLLIASIIGCRSQHQVPATNKSSAASSRRRIAAASRQGLETVCNTDAAANQILVKLRHPEAGKNKESSEYLNKNKEWLDYLNKIGATAEPVGNGDVLLVRSKTLNVSELSQSFNDKEKSGIIEYAEPNYVVSPDCKDPCGGHNEFIGQEWGLDKIGACDAWGACDQSNVIVAVIDSGIDCTFQDPQIKCNPDLNDNILKPPPGFSVKLGGRDVTCVKGCFGFDATLDDSKADWKKWSPEKGDGHGTQVSGIIAAANNGEGVIGVSYNSKVLMVKYTGALGYGFVASVKRAIDFIIAASEQLNIRVVNCSFGFDPNDSHLPECGSQTLKEAFEHLNQVNILIVASMGDFNGTALPDHPHYPSGYCLDNLIASTATDKYDNRYPASAFNLNALNLIGAPGAGIYTVQSSGYGTQDGSSFAAAFVSGAAALIASDTKHGCDKLSANGLRTKILENADKIDGLTGYIKEGRRLNVYNAILNCQK